MNAAINDTIPNGEAIVERFGGIRPMAAKLDVAVTTVQGWKKRDAIPLNRKEDILAAAAEHGINLKGLISGASANQNNAVEKAPKVAASGIAEDPALTRIVEEPVHIPAPAPAPVAPVQAQPKAEPKYEHKVDAQAAPAPKHKEMEYIDMAKIRSAARRTSLLTTLSLLALVGGAGFALFGNYIPGVTVTTGANAPAGVVQNTELEERVAEVEGNLGVLEQLRAQVDTMGQALGVNVEEFRTIAQGVSQGNIQPVLARLSTLEQYYAQAGGAEGLQSVINRMEQTLNQSSQGDMNWSSTIAQLQSVVNGLQGDMNKLNHALENVKTENSQLSENLQGVSGRDLGAAAMLLALTQVRYMIEREAPFENDLNLLRQVAGNDPEMNAAINRLAPYAESGVLSSEGLKRELQGLSNDIITAKMSGEDVSFKERSIARLNNLFSLKKDGAPVTGGEEAALIAKASAQLDANDVQGAMTTLQQLNGPAAKAADPVMQQAAATLAVQSLDRDLVTKLISRINQVRSGSQAPINMAPQRSYSPTLTSPDMVIEQ